MVAGSSLAAVPAEREARSSGRDCHPFTWSYRPIAASH